MDIAFRFLELNKERMAHIRAKRDAGHALSLEEFDFLIDRIDGKHKRPAHREKDPIDHARTWVIMCGSGTHAKRRGQEEWAVGAVAKEFGITKSAVRTAVRIQRPFVDRARRVNERIRKWEQRLLRKSRLP